MLTQLAKRNDSSATFIVGIASPQILCVVLSSTIYKVRYLRASDMVTELQSMSSSERKRRTLELSSLKKRKLRKGFTSL